MFPTFKAPLTTYRALIQWLKNVRRRVRGIILSFRWASAAAVKEPLAGESEFEDDIFRALDFLVINLEDRHDRLELFAAQMHTLGIESWQRVPGTDGRAKFPEMPPFFAGSLGCTMSHIDALNSINPEAARASVICEDDAEFLINRGELAILITEFLGNPKLDVLALYGRARGGSHAVSPSLRVAVGLVGRVCYVVKPHMIPILIEEFERGIPLLKMGNRRGKGDQMWRRLQSRGHFFATPRITAVRNRAGFSDIEGKQLGPR